MCEIKIDKKEQCVYINEYKIKRPTLFYYDTSIKLMLIKEIFNKTYEESEFYVKKEINKAACISFSDDFIINQNKPKLLNAKEYYKSVNLFIAEHLGYNFSKRMYKAQHNLWVNDFDKTTKNILKNVIKHNRFESSYNASYVINANDKELKPLILELQEKSLHKLIPLVVKYGKNLKELKELFGKGNWKKLCNNSITRNKIIADILDENTKKSTIDLLLDTKSNSIKLLSSYNLDENVLLLQKFDKVPEKSELHRLLNIYLDTKSMFNELGLTNFSEKWSRSRLQKEHDNCVKLINTKRHSSEILQEKLNYCELRGLKFIHLNDNKDVKLEGLEMKHCVGYYTNKIKNNEYAVFKVEGNKRFTLGLTIDKDGKYMFNQAYGVCNSRISDNSLEICNKFIKHLNKEKENATL